MVKVVLTRPFYLKKKEVYIASCTYVLVCNISQFERERKAAMGIAHISPFDLTYFSLIT